MASPHSFVLYEVTRKCSTCFLEETKLICFAKPI